MQDPELEDLEDLSPDPVPEMGGRATESAFVPLREHTHTGAHFKIDADEDWADLTIRVIGCHDNIDMNFHFSHHYERERLNDQLDHLDELIAQLLVYRDHYAARCEDILDKQDFGG